MFRKEFHVKSNISLKSSDKKKFASLLQAKFQLDGEEIQLKHDDVATLKVRSFQDDIIEIYLVNKIPWAFTFNEKLFPTVYFLWKYPRCLFTYTTHDSVMSKIQNGADLMLPGVILEQMEEISVKVLGNLPKGAPCAIRLPGNSAPFAVGYTNISSLDMLECGLRGKGVNVLHVIGDLLWKMGSKDPLPFIPLITAVSDNVVSEPEIQIPMQDSPVEVEGNDDDDDLRDVINHCDNIDIVDDQSPNDAEKGAVEPTISEQFRTYFLLAAKTLKSTDFPMLSSTFKGKILAPLIKQCDDSDRVVVEKTEYKKFSTFLQQMKEQGVIQLEERQKGVQYISGVKFDHDLFAYLPSASSISKIPAAGSNKPGKSADFKEMFSITAAVLPLIRLSSDPSAKKGDSISAPSLRSLTTDYVKSRNLHTTTKSNSVRLDELLAQCLGRKFGDEISWATLFDNLFAKLQPCYEFRFNDGSSGVRKGKPPTVVISVAKRAGNKRVVLINNLRPVGVDPAPFARELQVALAASATLNDVVHSEGPQVQVQGDDVDTVVKLLCEKHNVHKKCIKIL